MSLPPLGFATDTQLRDSAFATKLRRRRRLMLRWSLPVVVLAGLVALKFLTAVGLNLVGTSAYDRANFSTAGARYVNTQFLNIVQPWKAFFNEGTADYSAGRFFTATQSFDIALDKVPKNPEDQPRGAQECAVRVNYSLSLEGIADETFAVGDAAMAEHHYTQALDMLADCADSGEGGDTADDAQERQEEGQEQSQEQQAGNDPDDGGDPDGDDPDGDDPDGDDPDGDGDDPDADPEGQDPDGGDPEPAPSPSLDPKQEELEERNQRANETDDPTDGQDGIGDGSGQNW